MRDVLDQDQRLVLLRSLLDCGDSANESILQTCLQTYGHKVSRDTVRTQLAWLREQGLVTLSDVSGCYVAEITGRGDEVASGLTTVPGVKKPRPRG
ncbi:MULTISPECIES: VpaChn25_0724 family phage protein [Citrobacter freundii complex]|uniref:VpaChn25_0724 family phage protein n=1 Tax=Citrobacter freundii complex TaxID=1344959 RepID=UPI00149610CF|nr:MULTISPECIES: ArsR family transcriptional regulator [Citrobacter freundii complex]EGP0948992.1 ArsR family transcriptional regulator [Salmonella enterica subsp. enterica serovar Java]ELW9327614.1 ArsR family transcriptional regulator [Citrobacter freundii]ELW9351813.1 ArsR family transcriptional regulator [Citrobacter freundii]EMF0719795.1 ArsR family transcriptional regulator [Citrobacter freundii]MCR3700811.1 ArsR family transcriptional regulator [Citrobacter portucalensis]